MLEVEQIIEKSIGDIYDIYRFLQTCYGLELFMKTDIFPWKPVNLKTKEFDLDNGKYIIHGKYIAYGIQTSKDNGTKQGLVGSMSLLLSFSGIINLFYEIYLGKGKSLKFNKFVESVFNQKETRDNFDAILTFFRNCFTHRTGGFELKKDDFIRWIEKNKNRKIEMKFIFQNGPKYLIDIKIDVTSVRVGTSISEFIDSFQMLYLIELIILVCSGYMDQINLKK